MPMLNPSPLGQYVPYYGEPVAVVLWQVHYVVRCARTLGLYPTTAQLEHERRDLMTNNRAMAIHYRQNPWAGPQPTLCGRVAEDVAYTDNPAKVTCAKCAEALKARAA